MRRRGCCRRSPPAPSFALADGIEPVGQRFGVLCVAAKEIYDDLGARLDAAFFHGVSDLLGEEPDTRFRVVDLFRDLLAGQQAHDALGG